MAFHWNGNHKVLWSATDYVMSLFSQPFTSNQPTFPLCLARMTRGYTVAFYMENNEVS
jgi:hypothetical protein